MEIIQKESMTPRFQYAFYRREKVMPVWYASHADAYQTSVLEIFEHARRDGRTVHVSAPMVRYSKLPFRLLARDYGVDITYTPMMLAHEFVRSNIARDSDFTTNGYEREATKDGRKHALIAQFAASAPTEFARAAKLIAPWVDGIDLNCGCPQGWAIKEGIGCSLMQQPELVATMVRAAKAAVSSETSVSVKIRISTDLDKTKSWIREVEDAGVDYITIHGRTRSQRSSTPPNYQAIKILKAFATVPIIANGDAYGLEDVERIASDTGVDGVMAARGILEKPSLFAGDVDGHECMKQFLQSAIRHPIPYQLVQHHISDMMVGMNASKQEKRRMMECEDLLDLIDFIEARSCQSRLEE